MVHKKQLFLVSTAVLFLTLIGCRHAPMGMQAAAVDIQLVPTEATILHGDTLRIIAIPLDATGQPVLDVAVHWATSDTAITRIDSTGLLYGRGVGQAAITVSAGDVNRHLSVTVEDHRTGWTVLDVGCGIWHDGFTYCWPMTSGPVDTPTLLSVLENAATIQSGPNHTCAVTSTGDAYCWGQNDYGELGDGTTTDRLFPVFVISPVKFDSIAVGALHTCALSRSSDIYCWGADKYGQLGIGGASDLCASMPCSRVPRKVSGEFKAVAAGGFDRVGLTSNGLGSTCAIAHDAQLLCWGYNELGGGGDGTFVARSVPTPVASAEHFVAVAVGNTHACGLASGGEIFCWGANAYGQLGSTLPTEAEFTCFQADVGSPCTNEPRVVNTTERFMSVAADDDLTCALNSFGASFCWGENGFGQVGNGVVSRGEIRPTRVHSATTFLTVRIRSPVACGLSPRRQAFCWGSGVSEAVRLPDPGFTTAAR